MSASFEGLRRRAGDALASWSQRRVHESTHCRECGSEVAPFDSHCQNCGQPDPAKVSLSGAVYLVVGFVVVVFVLSSVIFAL